MLVPSLIFGFPLVVWEDFQKTSAHAKSPQKSLGLRGLTLLSYTHLPELLAETLNSKPSTTNCNSKAPSACKHDLGAQHPIPHHKGLTTYCRSNLLVICSANVAITSTNALGNCPDMLLMHIQEPENLNDK